MRNEDIIVKTIFTMHVENGEYFILFTSTDTVSTATFSKAFWISKHN